MPERPERRCGKCAHWRPTVHNLGHDVYGECHKRAPRRKSAKVGSAVWPEAGPDNGCGDFEPVVDNDKD